MTLAFPGIKKSSSFPSLFCMWGVLTNLPSPSMHLKVKYTTLTHKTTINNFGLLGKLIYSIAEETCAISYIINQKSLKTCPMTAETCRGPGRWSSAWKCAGTSCLMNTSHPVLPEMEPLLAHLIFLLWQDSDRRGMVEGLRRRTGKNTEDPRSRSEALPVLKATWASAAAQWEMCTGLVRWYSHSGRTPLFYHLLLHILKVNMFSTQDVYIWKVLWKNLNICILLDTENTEKRFTW